MSDKTKAALQGRLSHFTNVAEENNTAISLVNLSRSAGAGNYEVIPVLASKEFFIFSLKRIFEHSNGDIEYFLRPITFPPNYRQNAPINATAPKMLFIKEDANPNRGGFFINEYDVELFKSLCDLGNGFIFGNFHDFYPLGSIPRDCSSFRRTRFIQVARDESPSFFISASSCIRSSCWSRIWYWSVFALSLDIVITKSILSASGCNYNVTEMVLQLLNTAKPRSARTLSGLLTKPLTGVTKMAGSQHTQTHHKFTWRFLALSVTESSIVRITAATEREAREQSPAGCVMVFAGRLPVQGVSHA